MTMRHLLSPKCWQEWWGRGRPGEEMLRALLCTVMQCTVFLDEP